MRTLLYLLLASLLVLTACGGAPVPPTIAEPAQPPPAQPTAAPAPPTPPAAPPPPTPTVGSGDLAHPAIGPDPLHAPDGSGFVLVKNWDFGTGPGSTIRSMSELSEHFQYHDQFKTISNQYGALIVAPDEATALTGKKQPVEGRNTSGKPVRAFTTEALQTFLVPLDGAEECHPSKRNLGCGSIQAKWKLPKGGSRLGKDILWETRVRYNVPPYFWFAIWCSGNTWSKGAEIDVVESFGYDNGGGATNFDGRFWHSGIVGGTQEIHYGNWRQTMAKQGVKDFDATTWHVWTMLYKADNTIALYMDGILVQRGFSHWTLATKPDGEEIDMSFIFDGSWGHTKVDSVNKPLPAAAFVGKSYEWDYSRIYLRSP